MKSKFNRLIDIFLGTVVFLLPLLVLPFFTDVHDFSKTMFLVVATLLGFVLWTAKSLIEKKITFSKSSLAIPLLGLFIVSVVSCLINTPNKIQSLISLGGGATLFLCLLVYLYLKNLSKIKTIPIAVITSGALMALMTIVLSSGLITLPLNFPSLNLSITDTFSPIGNILGQTIWLACVIPLGMAMAYESIMEKKNISAVLFFVASILCLAGIGLGINFLTSSAKPVLLSKAISWSIAMDSLKTARTALFGIGPGQYLNAFTAFKPIAFNSTSYWNLSFGYTNWLYQVLTELGLLGIIFYLLIAWKIVKSFVKVIRQSKPSPLALATGISLIILLVTQFYLPLNVTLLFLFFVILAVFELLLGNNENREFDLSPLGQTVYLFLIFPLILWGAIVFFSVKTSLADYYYLNSLKATAANDGTAAYQLQIKAIDTNPNLTTYRIAYANTNFALANALASKQDLTDNDRNTISQLIQQAIREAKSAVSLDPSSAYAWENLGALYNNLINFAEGSDQWAIASYQEAIKNDPLNPVLRLDLGGIYFSQKDYSQAANLFSQVINLKSDFANGHYNLANTLVQLEDFADAKTEYENTLSLVKIDSNDYQKVLAELEEVKKRLPTPTPAQQLQPETLSTPEQPVEGINPPLELPSEAAPVSESENPVPTVPTTEESVTPQEQPLPEES